MKQGLDKKGWVGERGVSRLEALYRRYVAHVYTLCLRLLSNVRAAEEATIRVFVQFSRELARRWDESLILGRLRDLTIIEAIRGLTANPVEGLKARAADGVTPPATERESSTTVLGRPGKPEATPVDSATLDVLTARLPDDLRVAFVLHDREGLSPGAIAKHLQIEEAQARRLINRARLRLRHLLSQR